MPGKSKARQAEEQHLEEFGIGTKGQYHIGFPRRAYELCLLGHTNADLARVFGVHESSIERWMREKPAFKRAILNGREIADGQAAASLFARVRGVTVVKERAVTVGGQVKILKLKEELPGDVNAAALWLSNRQRGKWKAANAGSDQQSSFDLGAFVAGLTARAPLAKSASGDDAKPVQVIENKEDSSTE